MAGETEFGECCVCTAKTHLKRTYWHYDIDCDCHSPKHFEVRRHCRYCTPNEPLYTEVDCELPTHSRADGLGFRLHSFMLLRRSLI